MVERNEDLGVVLAAPGCAPFLHHADDLEVERERPEAQTHLLADGVLRRVEEVLATFAPRTTFVVLRSMSSSVRNDAGLDSQLRT